MTLCPGYQQPSPFIRQLSLEPGGLRVGWRGVGPVRRSESWQGPEGSLPPSHGGVGAEAAGFHVPGRAALCCWLPRRLPGACPVLQGGTACSGWVWGTGSLAAPFGWERQGMSTRVGECGCRGPSAPYQTCFLGLSPLQSWCCPPLSPEPRHHPGWVLQTATICGAPSA